MDSQTVAFQVSPRLTEILGENYHSTEAALKELIDNAWDADASEVRITLPAPMSTDPLIVVDNGAGMKLAEVELEYLSVARDRRVSKGEKTKKFRRKAKGRKGIGKFAGLMIADSMQLETHSNGEKATLELRRSEILDHQGDLENFPVRVMVDEAPPTSRGTKITLSDLHQNLQFPNPDKLRILLVREYGREEEFKLFVNEDLITFFDIPGQRFEHEVDLPSGGKAQVKFTIAEGKRKIPQSGLVVRVNGKTCGPASHFGLEDDEILPRKLVERAVGEIEIETRDEALVTADWGGLIESNNDTVKLNAVVPEFLRDDLEVARTKEVNLAKARYQKIVNKRLAKLPEYRRDFAQKRLANVFEMFFHENEERFDSIIGVVLDSFEKDEYWAVVEKLHDAKDPAVGDLAETLNQFGLIDIGVIGRQAHARLEVLDNLEKLVADDATTEDQVHTALDANLWIFDDTGRLLSSNETIRRIVDTYLDKRYSGERQRKRPDIITAHDFQNRFLLVELKRPSVSISRKHEAQAIEYRDDLQPHMSKIDILLIGKSRDPAISAINDRDGIQVWSYAELITKARRRIQWLIDDLKR